MVLSYKYVAHFRHSVCPAVHDHRRRVCGKDNLDVGVQFEDEVDETLLPVYMQTHLGLVHKEDVGLVVFHKHRHQYHEHLFLAAGELVGSKYLTYLTEGYVVAASHQLLSRVGKEAVNHVLELLLRLRYLLCLHCSVGIAALQHAMMRLPTFT